MNIQQFEARKHDHLRLALDPAHQAQGASGLEQIHLNHDALPELDFQDVSLTSVRLGKFASTPFYIAGMTAGHREASTLNRVFARACSQRGWAMGVGSQRRQIEEISPQDIDQCRQLRQEFPDLDLFANLGLPQILDLSTEKIQLLVDSIQAQGLAIHLNALQESFQPEGTPRFKGGLSRLREICETLRCPVILKETGCGFSVSTLNKISGLGLAAIDVSGRGGTHWGRIEGMRSTSGSICAEAAKTFAHWGEPTVDSILNTIQVLPGMEIWASGGIRSGLDAAKAIALGASQVGYAKPALEAALQGELALLHWMELQEFELKTALFCTGSINSTRLREREGAWRYDSN